MIVIVAVVVVAVAVAVVAVVAVVTVAAGVAVVTDYDNTHLQLSRLLQLLMKNMIAVVNGHVPTIFY